MNPRLACLALSTLIQELESLEPSAKANAKRKPWEDSWEILSNLSGGGQGNTFLVKLRKPNAENEKYVLKILRDQDVLERRQRMHREVKAQQQLDHPRLPKIKECNTEACGDLAVPLFFVMDHIDGRTLEERVMEAPLHPDEAIRLVIDLSAVLIYCHERGIIHRDIKPNNIILRGGNPADPFLIDFGLSFNQLDSEQSSLTPDWQQLGNRFLHLPELQTADSSKRYVESDISQLCGVLFYALTGQVPAHLKDHEGRKPHERVSAKAILDKIDSPALIYLSIRVSSGI